MSITYYSLLKNIFAPSASMISMIESFDGVALTRSIDCDLAHTKLRYAQVELKNFSSRC
ncbi:MAG TPA: hypothetical protein VJ656_05580 [Pyrinomonadaceae bacterium]|nr:hypothetical protein [Pyrinomonadaceae bacterium]